MSKKWIAAVLSAALAISSISPISVMASEVSDSQASDLISSKTETSTDSTKPRIKIENLDKKNGSFSIRVSNLSISDSSKVELAVWGMQDGQNDIVWSTPEKDGNDYVAEVSATQHKCEDGSYSIHCYISDEEGNRSLVAYSGAYFSLREGMILSMDQDEMYARIAYVGAKAEDNLRVAVWNDDNNQEDLTWYNLTLDGNGASVAVPISNHKKAGKYTVHLYKDNTLLDNSSFTVSDVTASDLSISDIDGSKGRFRVTLSGIDSASGVESVSIPIWPGNDQSQIKWYTAEKDGDSYYVDADVLNHGLSFGDYTAHAYVTSKNGIKTRVKSASCHITAENYLYAESTGNYTARVYIVNPAENTSKIQFATWSAEGNQDDLTWCDGIKEESNTWYVDIDSANFKHGGSYMTHCYVTADNSTSCVASVSYNLEQKNPNSNQDMFELAQGISSPTEYLILVNRDLHRVAIYQGSEGAWQEVQYWPCVVGKPSTPTPTGTFHIKGRFSWFGEGHKSWWATQIEGYYYFHSQIYYWDDAPNTVLDPAMDTAASAGCIRLYVDNAYWIYTTIPRGTTVYIYN